MIKERNNHDSDVQSLRGLLLRAPVDIIYDDDIGIPGNRTGIWYRLKGVRLRSLESTEEERWVC